MYRVTLRPTQLNKGKFTVAEKNELIKKAWHVEYYLGNKRCTDRGGEQPLNRIKDFDERFKVITEMQAGIVMGFSTGMIQTLDYNNLTIEQAADIYINHCKEFKDNEGTVAAYQYKLDDLTSAMGKVPIKDLSRKEAKNFVEKLAKENKWKGVTTNNAVNVYKGLFNWLIEQEYIELNPFKMKATKTAATTKHKAYRATHLRMLMEAVSDDRMVTLFCKTLYYAAIRPTELCLLKVKDIDMERQQIIVPASIAKNNDEGVINIDDYLYGEFKKLELHKYNRNDYLFTCEPTIIGKVKMNRNHVTNIVRDKLKELDIYDDNGYTVYGLKHTANCQRVLDGWSLIDIMIVNRHNSISTTEKYITNLKRIYNLNRGNHGEPVLPITKPK